jgi:hypothetical protein
MKRSVQIVAIGLALVVGQTVCAQSDKKTPLAKETKNKSSFLCMHDCGTSRQETFDVSNKSYKGETVRGPVTVVAYNLNPLRFSYKWQSDVTFTAAPDLWSKLTGIGVPQSSAKPPSPPAPKAPTAQSALPGHAMRSALQQPGGTRTIVAQGQPAISQETLDLVRKAQSAIDAGQQAVENVNGQIVGLDQALKDAISEDFNDVTAQVVSANIATNNVTLAGQELVTFLVRVDASSTYDGIKNELSDSTDFNFMKGVNAHWPEPATVAKLQNSVDARKSVLSSKKTTLDGVHPSLLAGIAVAQRDLEAADDNLEYESTKLTANPRSDAEEELVKKTIEALKARLGEVNEAKTELQDASDTLNWAITETAAMETALSSLDTSSDKFKAFQTAQATLVQWRHNMMQLKQMWESYQADKDHVENPFVTSFSAGCDYTFATTKKNAIKLTQVDNLPDKSAAAPTDVLSLTMMCASPFNVSAGVAFSTIPSREFAIEPVATPPGSTTTTNEFVLQSNSSFHPLPIGMVSARLCEPNEKISFHLSLGVAGNFNSQSAGGSSAEFLIGPSIALFRTMFLTPGLHIGKKTTLGDGFVLGNPTPPNVTSAPIESSYTTGFGFAITFTKP